MTDETALPAHTIAQATPDDMPFIGEAVRRLRAARQLAEPAGAAATAAALKLDDRLKGKKVALILSGGNLSPDELRRILGPRRR